MKGPFRGVAVHYHHNRTGIAQRVEGKDLPRPGNPIPVRIVHSNDAFVTITRLTKGRPAAFAKDAAPQGMVVPHSLIGKAQISGRPLSAGLRRPEDGQEEGAGRHRQRPHRGRCDHLDRRRGQTDPTSRQGRQAGRRSARKSSERAVREMAVRQRCEDRRLADGREQPAQVTRWEQFVAFPRLPANTALPGPSSSRIPTSGAD